MKKYLIKLSALFVAAILGVCALAGCGDSSDAPTDKNAGVTENVTEATENNAE